MAEACASARAECFQKPSSFIGEGFFFVQSSRFIVKPLAKRGGFQTEV